MRVCLCLLLFAGAGSVAAQPPADRRADPPATVRMNIRGEVTLDVLVRYLSDRVGLKVLYDSDLAARTVTIRTPDEIAVEALPAVLDGVLRSQNLAIVDAEIDGWKRIIELKTASLYAPRAEASQILRQSGSATPVTQVFRLTYLQADRLAPVLKPFLTEKDAQVAAIAENNSLLITDYAVNIVRVEELLNAIDRPAGEARFDFFTVRHQSSQVLAEQVQAILTDTAEAAPAGQGRATASKPKVKLVDEPRGNRIIVAGEADLVVRALDLLERLDVPLDVVTRAYRLQNLSAERLSNVVQAYLPPQDRQRAFEATIDEEGNLLVVRTTAVIHRQIEALIGELDRPVKTSESPLRFYKLKNARAVDVLLSLLALQEAYGGGGFAGGYGLASPFGGVPVFPGAVVPGVGTPGSLVPGLNRGLGGLNGLTPGVPTTQLPLPSGGTVRDERLVDNSNPLPSTLVNGLGAGQSAVAGNGLGAGGFGGGFGGGLGGGFGGGVATLPGGARVSADQSTNSIIVVAPANVQPMYAKLIESLDQRRPQVLIEAKIIAIDTSDNYSLGVEVSVGDRIGDTRLFSFSSFGLSEVDPISGALAISPALGFNGTLVDPDVADVVVQALAQHTRARVLAAPKILVTDNSTGKLESTVSVPFASVNAAETISTTSLGGNQQAGTIISVTPQINEDNNLQLIFDVEFSTFQGAGTGVLPPARQIDRVGSTVTIPDGQTVVVGGLKRINESDEFIGIPILEHIPIIRELSSRTANAQSTTSFFVFIKPAILRDSQFKDLKFYSCQESRAAGERGAFPRSSPLLLAE